MCVFIFLPPTQQPWNNCSRTHHFTALSVLLYVSRFRDRCRLRMTACFSLHWGDCIGAWWWMTACFSLHRGDCISAWWWLTASVSIRVTALVPDDDWLLQSPSGWLHGCLMMTDCFSLHQGDCIGAWWWMTDCFSLHQGDCMGAWWWMKHALTHH